MSWNSLAEFSKKRKWENSFVFAGESGFFGIFGHPRKVCLAGHFSPRSFQDLSSTKIMPKNVKFLFSWVSFNVDRDNAVFFHALKSLSRSLQSSCKGRQPQALYHMSVYKLYVTACSRKRDGHRTVTINVKKQTAYSRHNRKKYALILYVDFIGI